MTIIHGNKEKKLTTEDILRIALGKPGPAPQLMPKRKTPKGGPK